MPPTTRRASLSPGPQCHRTGLVYVAPAGRRVLPGASQLPGPAAHVGAVQMLHVSTERADEVP